MPQQFVCLFERRGCMQLVINVTWGPPSHKVWSVGFTDILLFACLQFDTTASYTYQKYIASAL